MRFHAAVQTPTGEGILQGKLENGRILVSFPPNTIIAAPGKKEAGRSDGIWTLASFLESDVIFITRPAMLAPKDKKR